MHRDPAVMRADAWNHISHRTSANAVQISYLSVYAIHPALVHNITVILHAPRDCSTVQSQEDTPTWYAAAADVRSLTYHYSSQKGRRNKGRNRPAVDFD